MNRKFLPTTGAILAVMLLSLAAGCADTGPAPDAEHDHDHDHGEGHAGESMEAEEGPMGGRILEDGDFSLEVTMFETGVPPEFRVYPRRDGKAVSPADIQLTVEVTRLGGVIDRIAFEPQGDYLRSTSSIYEPHSFAVKVQARTGNEASSWTYESFEGRTRIAPEMAKGAGVETAVAGPGQIEEQLSLYGTIQADPQRVRSVSARFPGIIRSVRGKVGDVVRQGQQLATVESNESLQTYGVTAPISGVITERHANPGEASDEAPLFQIADFSAVRAELNVFPRDRGRLRPGQSVRVKAADGAQEASGVIDFVSPLGTGTGQTVVVRVQLDNKDSAWTPGQFIEGSVTISATELPVVIRRDALQTFRDWDVAFVNVGDTYEFRPLELGRSDGERVEIISGLKAGDTYVTANSYLIKADIEKSGASHDH